MYYPIVIPLLKLFVCRFIEYGEYKENLYGTSIEAIRSVQAKNKMCLVDVQPEVNYSSFCLGCDARTTVNIIIYNLHENSKNIL